MDEMDDLARLQALYRASAHEAPRTAVDDAILGAAANKVRRDKAVPFLALAAGLVVAVLIGRDLNQNGAPTPGAAPEVARDYLLALHTPPSEAAAAEASAQ